MDLPATALELIRRFIAGQTFADQPLPSDENFGAMFRQLWWFVRRKYSAHL